MHCKKCGAEALQSSKFCRLCGREFRSGSSALDRIRLAARLILLLVALLLLILAFKSGAHGQTPPRQVWIIMKAGPIITGDLVKMDGESVDFKVKGILQSLKLDELKGVMFYPPPPRPQIPPEAQAQIDAARKRSADLQAAIAREAQPAPRPSTPAPPTHEVEGPPVYADKCEHHNATIERGHYHHEGFANSMHDFHYKGEFHASGGKVNFYITDTENFAKFMNHKKFQAFFSLEKVTDGNFDVAFQKGVDYHLVILNPSVYDGRSVETDFCFSYPSER